MATTADYRKYRTWFTLFLIVLLGGFFLATLVYNGRFNLIKDPFSRLGASKTPEGADNRASMAVFVVDMAITAVIFGRLAVAFARDSNLSFRGLRVLISITAALGACIATFPNNYFLTQHQLGAGFLVGSIWLHAILFIADASKVTSRGYGLFLHLLLQSTILYYAFTFFVEAPERDIVQKIAIIGLALAIELALGACCKEPSTADESIAHREARSTEVNR